MTDPDSRARETVLNTVLRISWVMRPSYPSPKMIDTGFDALIVPFTPDDLAGSYVGFAPDPIIVAADGPGFGVHIGGTEKYHFTPGKENRIVLRARMPLQIGVLSRSRFRRALLDAGHAVLQEDEPASRYRFSKQEGRVKRTSQRKVRKGRGRPWPRR